MCIMWGLEKSGEMFIDRVTNCMNSMWHVRVPEATAVALDADLLEAVLLYLRARLHLISSHTELE